MAWLVALTLFAIGIFLLDSSQFIGFLTIIAGIFALLLKGGGRGATPSHEPSAAYPAPPIIVRSGGKAPDLDQIKLRVKEGWAGTTAVEDFFDGLFRVVFLPIKIFWRLLRIGRGKK